MIVVPPMLEYHIQHVGVNVLLFRFLLSWHCVRASQVAPPVADIGPRRKGAEDMGGKGAGPWGLEDSPVSRC